MARQPQPLPTKLKAVIVRLGKAVDLNVTKAVKLPYLVDVVANRVLGHPITECRHQAWEQGVVTSEAWRYLDKSTAASEAIWLEPVRYSEERVVVFGDDDDSALTNDEKEVVDAVAEEFGGIAAGELGRMTKLMNPEIAQWGSNHGASVTEDAFEMMRPEYQRVATRLMRMTVDELRRTSVSLDQFEGPLA